MALINHTLKKADDRQFGPSSLPQTRVVERIYWSVNVAPIAGILDVVRTTLVELVAEMRVGTPRGEALPPHEVAEQAVDIAIYGKKNRVLVTHVAAGSQVAVAAAGPSAVASGAPESRARALMWWVVGISGLVAAIAAVWILFE